MSTQSLNKDTFESTVTAPGIVLVDFWAPWCGPCRRFGPIFEKVSESNPDIIFAKVDTEAQQELGAMLRIQSIPTLMIFRDGIPVYRQAGSMPQEALEDLVAQVRGLDMADVHRRYEEARKAHAQARA
jgi:thioredoxin 1